ncbi:MULTISPECIES: restriction endonuclease subunit S [unclassified Aerococcus]|uniref:restriction endonuclease subunit S n=1 Tax=unclassified Aerococcus TaxID=2618060 RepID=UPI0008A2B53C|nr:MULTISPECIES: restriction endonuclease subunit S [unclassified Aerococcus]MDK6939950.1 restriction endonuclease subunit S [Aerococcus sp. UMB8487]OFT37903.1 hypothetical protein HMPREF3161_08630 [Aerococcus sp. HMSC06H08]
MVFLQRKGVWVKIGSFRIGLLLTLPKRKNNWIQCELGEILDIRNEKIIPDSDYPLMSFTSSGGIEEKGDRYDRSFLVKNSNKKYKVTKFNDLIYSSNNLDVGAIGLNKFGNACISIVYEIFSIIDDNPDVVSYILQTPRILHKIISYRQGALYGQYKIHSTDFLKVKIFIPKMVEQEKISELINNLDFIITLEQEKIEKLELLKQAYENKIFDPNFTSKNWSYKKIGDLFEERKIRSAKGELLSVTIENGVVKASEIDRTINASSDRSNYKLVEPNDIAYNSMRMWQGACGASNYEGIVSPAYTVLVPKEDVNSKFFEYYFKSPYMLYQFASFSQGLTSDTWNLKYPIIKDIEIYVPNINEQNQIESFLSTYYGLIKQNQKRIDLYDQVKYCLLNKLFI